MSEPFNIITTTVNTYISVFESYQAQFFTWGRWLFCSSLTIAIVWLCLWRAFDSSSFQDSMSQFIQEFFVIALFYTIMLNSVPWLSSIVKSAAAMGATIAHQQVDPSSVIQQGLTLANKILFPVQHAGFWTNFLGLLITWVVYLSVLFVFITIALDLAITLISVTFLISLSALLLAFAVFPFTRSVARKTLDLVIAKSFKLLALYIIIAAGSGVFTKISSILPTEQINGFDIYAWTCATAFLFWLIAKAIPQETANILSEVIQESRSADSAGHLLALNPVTDLLIKPLQASGSATFKMASAARNTLSNAKAHFDHFQSTGQHNLTDNLKKAVTHASQDFGHAVRGSLSDRFRHIGSKLGGGSGLANKIADIPDTAQRIKQATQNIKSNTIRRKL